MDRYCEGWSASDGLCVPQLIKLVSNSFSIGAIIILFYFISVGRKRLSRFW